MVFVIPLVLLFHFVPCSHTPSYYTQHTSTMTSQHTGKFTWGVGPQKVSNDCTWMIHVKEGSLEKVDNLLTL